MRSPSFTSRAVLAASALFLAGCAGQGSPAIPSPATGGTFIVTLGNDTVAVEQYTRSGNRLEGDLVTRQPNTRILHYVATLDANGTPTTVEMRVRRADGSFLPGQARSAVLTYGKDSSVTIATMADSNVTRRVATKAGSFPWINNSFALWELGLMQARRSGRDSIDINYQAPGSPQNVVLPMWFAGRDSARIAYFGSPMLVATDRDGHILGINGDLTTNKVHVRRVGTVDLPALATAFAARDAAGQPLGAASPRDTARATVNGATLWVDYGRPARRGRDVWANGVLGDTLWRTGANAATQFFTSKDVEIGGKPVPAGTYTLWTHAARGGYELVVNRQVGQWGTDYHPEQDLVRVTLIESLAPETERFTIALEPQGSDVANLVMKWGRKALSVPVRVK